MKELLNLCESMSRIIGLNVDVRVRNQGGVDPILEFNTAEGETCLSLGLLGCRPGNLREVYGRVRTFGFSLEEIQLLNTVLAGLQKQF